MMRDLKQVFRSVMRTALQAGALVSCAEVKSPPQEPTQAPTNSPQTLAASASAPKETDLSSPIRKLQAHCTKIKALPNSGVTDSIIIKGYALGEPCHTATEKPRCEAAINEALDVLTDTQALLIKEGGEMKVVSDKDLVATFGKIDSADKALALLIAKGQDKPLCDEKMRVEETAAGVVFHYPYSIGECLPTDGTIAISLDGSVKEVKPEPVFCRGRKPEGLHERMGAREVSALGAFFSRAAWEESASVPAFQILVRDLQHLKAPYRLIHKALAAVEDELRHAEQMSILAEHFGAAVELPIMSTPEIKTAKMLAEENMREGCIHEMFAALLATYQAEHATDEVIAEVMKHIAEDEAQHAMLAWEIHDWVDGLLTQEERESLHEVQRQALEGLAEKYTTLSEEDARQVGWPSVETIKALLTGLRAELSI